MSLEQGIQCPVCLKIKRNKKYYSCRTGHSLCEDCYQRITNKRCPLGCKTGYFNPPTRNFTIEYLIENCTPKPDKVSCSNRHCDFTAKENDILQHEREDCPEMPIVCCTVVYPKSLHKDHIEKYHHECPNECSYNTTWTTALDDHFKVCRATEKDCVNSPSLSSSLNKVSAICTVNGYVYVGFMNNGLLLKLHPQSLKVTHRVQTRHYGTSSLYPDGNVIMIVGWINAKHITLWSVESIVPVQIASKVLTAKFSAFHLFPEYVYIGYKDEIRVDILSRFDLSVLCTIENPGMGCSQHRAITKLFNGNLVMPDGMRKLAVFKRGYTLNCMYKKNEYFKRIQTFLLPIIDKEVIMISSSHNDLNHMYLAVGYNDQHKTVHLYKLVLSSHLEIQLNVVLQVHATHIYRLFGGSEDEENDFMFFLMSIMHANNQNQRFSIDGILTGVMHACQNWFRVGRCLCHTGATMSSLYQMSENDKVKKLPHTIFKHGIQQLLLRFKIELCADLKMAH